MSHMVQMSNTNGPLLGQNGLSPAGEARLDHRVVERGGEDLLALGRRRLDPDGAEVVVPGLLGVVLAPLEHGWPGDRQGRVIDRHRGVATGAAGVRTVGPQVLPGLLDAAQREPEPQLDDLAGLGAAPPHQTERAQGGRPDAVEIEPGPAGHQPPVVPEQLAPVTRRRTRRVRPAGCPRRSDLPGRRPGSAGSRWARSGMVAPYGMPIPPWEKSTTSRASGWAGKV